MVATKSRYKLAMSESFVSDMNRLPKRVAKAVREAWPLLRDHPPQPTPPKIKRLNGYQRLWRLRVSDSYRVVYRIDVDAREATITLLMVGDRKDIYERLGANEDGEPGIEIIMDDPGGLIEREATPEEMAEAFMNPPSAASVSPDNPLPFPLTVEQLAEWGIDTKYHAAFGGVTTEGELLGLADRLPPDVVEYVLNAIWPPPIMQVVQEPVRIVDEPDAILEVREGLRDLDSFLLKLDDDQKAFVGRFDRDAPQGPWLLKGGPGSGKSVVALYCIRELIDRESQKLPGQRRHLRILLTTYTNSLINASRHLLKAIGAIGSVHTVRIETLDRIVMEYLSDEWRQLSPIDTGKAKSYATAAVAECVRQQTSFGFTVNDAPYLLEEVDWVIVGQDLRSLADYSDRADRSGRKRGLGKRQREQVWLFYEEFTKRMRAAGKCLFTERQQAALSNAQPAFDYVFIDEAQDLRPVGLRLAVALAEPTTNVFVTADSNQSIYATGMSWTKVAEDLKFTGRTQILRRNYRTTHEIWNAVKQLSPAAEDAETLDAEPVYHGSPPQFVRHRSPTALGKRLNEFLFESMREERVGPDSAAVLCPTRKVMGVVLELLDPTFNARSMTAANLAIDYRGVTVTTMHAAKGLGFPIVAIVGVDDGKLPWPATTGTDPADHIARQHRLLFVAGTRAMKRLFLATDAVNPSPFVAGVTDDYWEIEVV